MGAACTPLHPSAPLLRLGLAAHIQPGAVPSCPTALDVAQEAVPGPQRVSRQISELPMPRGTKQKQMKTSWERRAREVRGSSHKLGQLGA